MAHIQACSENHNVWINWKQVYKLVLISNIRFIFQMFDIYYKMSLSTKADSDVIRRAEATTPVNRKSTILIINRYRNVFPKFAAFLCRIWEWIDLELQVMIYLFITQIKIINHNEHKSLNLLFCPNNLKIFSLLSCDDHENQ